MDISYDTKSLISWTCTGIYDYHRSMHDKLFYQADFEYFVQGMLSEVKSSTQVRMRYVAVKKKTPGILRICVHVRTTYAHQKIIGTDLLIEIIDALVLVQLRQKQNTFDLLERF